MKQSNLGSIIATSFHSVIARNEAISVPSLRNMAKNKTKVIREQQVKIATKLRQKSPKFLAMTFVDSVIARSCEE